MKVSLCAFSVGIELVIFDVSRTENIWVLDNTWSYRGEERQLLLALSELHPLLLLVFPLVLPFNHIIHTFLIL